MYASEREAHRAVTHHVEHLLQAKVLYSQAQLTLTHLNPLGEDGIIFRDAVGDFFHVS